MRTICLYFGFLGGYCGALLAVGWMFSSLTTPATRADARVELARLQAASVVEIPDPRPVTRWRSERRLHRVQHSFDLLDRGDPDPLSVAAAQGVPAPEPRKLWSMNCFGAAIPGNGSKAL